MQGHIYGPCLLSQIIHCQRPRHHQKQIQLLDMWMYIFTGLREEMQVLLYKRNYQYQIITFALHLVSVIQRSDICLYWVLSLHKQLWQIRRECAVDFADCWGLYADGGSYNCFEMGLPLSFLYCVFVG